MFGVDIESSGITQNPNSKTGKKKRGVSMAKIIGLSNQKGGVGKIRKPCSFIIPVEHCNLHLYEV